MKKNFKTLSLSKILKLKYNLKLSDLKIAEFILDYTHGFSSKYMLYKNLPEFIKKLSSEERMFFVINSCNIKSPSKQEQFLLALAYSNLGTLYNNFAIYYLKLYVNDLEKFIFYDKDIRHCNNQNDKLNFQINLFNYKLALKYEENLDYDNALKHALMSKGMNSSYSLWNEPYCLIAEILYKKRDYKNSIATLKEGYTLSTNPYDKKRCLDLMNKYSDYQKKGHYYKEKNIKRPRLDIKTNKVYDLVSGEILENIKK